MLTLLFLNHSDKQCGVYQYGKRLFDILKKTNDIAYVYKEINNIEEYKRATVEDVSGIIYNYHYLTMPWLSSATIQKRIVNIGIPHESPTSMFDKICNLETGSIPRPIFEEINYDIHIETPAIKDFIASYKDTKPIFGSFGFGFSNKGFDKIIKMINAQYEEAIIKLVIPQCKFAGNTNEALNIKKNLMKIPTKKGIRVLITNDFFSEEEILLFLHTNTMNLFLYDKLHDRGISSTIDYALSVKKPFGISDSYMFRHIYNDDICLYKRSIHECMVNSSAVIDKFLHKNSHSALIEAFRRVVHGN